MQTSDSAYFQITLVFVIIIIIIIMIVMYVGAGAVQGVGWEVWWSDKVAV